MRTLTDHIVGGDEAAQLTITVTDEPGAGGANHEYEITSDEQPDTTIVECRLSFQEGPIKEVGINGVTNEALLAIVIDRLRSFQAGPFPSSLNAEALDHTKFALQCLQQRTKDRIKRGVEGTATA